MVYSSLLVIFKKKDVNYCCSLKKKKMVENKKKILWSISLSTCLFNYSNCRNVQL